MGIFRAHLAAIGCKGNDIACVNERVAKLFSVLQLQIQPVTDLCNWQSCKLLMAYPKLLLFLSILWATVTEVYPSIEHYQSNYRSMRAVYPILSVSCELLCILW